MGAYGARSFVLVTSPESIMGKNAWSKLTPRTLMYLALFLLPWMGLLSLVCFAILFGLKTFLFQVFTI